jgi:DDE superfamily endonuclease
VRRRGGALVRHHAAMCMAVAESADPVGTLVAFREAVYAAFGPRRDALFDLLDALLTAGAVPSPVHLSLAPAHRRGWGSLYAALAQGEVSAPAIERLLAGVPLPVAADEPAIYAVDGSVWPRCDAETSPERGYYHHPWRHSNGQPIVAGWLYQWVAQVRLSADSWTAPLSVERVPPGANANEVAAQQIRRVVAQRPADGKLPWFVCDAGYDPVRLAVALDLSGAAVQAAIVVRLRSGRCFYADPPPFAVQAAAAGRGRRPGRPRRHGQKLACASPATWWAPSAEHLEDDPAYGRVRVRAWGGVHAKTQEHPTRGTRGPRPIERGALLLLQVERLPRQTRVPQDVWLWWQGPPGAAPDLARVWRAYVHRFDLEHTFRFAKETLRWTAPRVRRPQAADRWTALVALAYTQLRLAQPVVADQRLPWERPLRQERLTPGRVRRQFCQLRVALGTPASLPKPAGRPAGRPKGRRYRPAPRYPAVKLREDDGSRRLLLAA